MAIASFYALLLGFVVFVVWGQLNAIQSNVSIEGSSAMGLYRDIKFYPDTNDSKQLKIVYLDFVFNVGLGTARQFHMTILAIQKGDWKEAARQMEDSLWFKQVADRGQRIVSMIRSG